jgi:DNA-binding transcriptional MerR regulator
VGRTWRIGEVAERTGLTRRALRHYDELGLLVPSARSRGDYRLYDTDDLLRLLQIQNLKALGLGLPEIAEALADPSLDAAATLRHHLGQLEARIAAEQQLAVRLRSLADADETGWEDVLAAIALARRLAHPDPVVRLRAALDDRGSAAELMAALVDESELGVQDVLIWALARQPGALDLALPLLSDPDPGVRRLMALLLHKVGDPAATPALVERLADPDAGVGRAAAVALGRMRDPLALPALAARLGVGAATAEVTDALAGYGEAATVTVTAVLRNGTSPAREQAAEVLGRGGDAAAVTALVAALADPLPAVRLAAVVALGDLGQAGRTALEPWADDPELGALVRRLL